MQKEKKDHEELITHYLVGELSDQEKYEMKDKMQNIDEKDNLEKIILELEQQESKLDDVEINAAADWLLVRKQIGFLNKPQRIPAFKYFSRIAAIFILALGLTYLLTMVVKVSDNQAKGFKQYTTLDQVENITLDDGSVISLNKNSKLILSAAFNDNNRDVILEGEAFFDIARNEEIPFKIFIQNSTVEVLGTSFNIKSDSAKVLVNVLSGHVAFYETNVKENGVELEKEEIAEYDIKESHFLKSESFDPNILSWLTQELVFQNTGLNDVFTTLASHFDKELVCSLDTSIDETYNGAFKEQSLDEIIEAITLSLTTELDVLVTEEQLIVTTLEYN